MTIRDPAFLIPPGLSVRAGKEVKAPRRWCWSGEKSVGEHYLTEKAGIATSQRHMPEATPYRILVIRLSSLGDVILATPVVQALKKRYPWSEISWVVKKDYAELLAGDTQVDRIIPLDVLGSHRGVRGLAGFLRVLRETEYDLVVDLQDNVRSRVILTSCRSAAKVRYDKQALRRRWLVWGTWIFGRNPKVSLETVVGRYLKSLESVGVSDRDYQPRISLGAEDRAFAREFLGEVPERGRPLVGLCPGAKRETKRWPAERFAQLADRLAQDRNASILLLGSPEEAQLVTDVQRLMTSPVIQAAGKTSLRGLACLLEQCQVVVTNDSGPMHLAGAVGIPVVALFGPTVPELGFRPQGLRDVVIEKKLSSARAASMVPNDVRRVISNA